MNAQTGKTTSLFSTTVGTKANYLSASSLSASTRQYYAVLTSFAAGSNILVVTDIDSGGTTQIPTTWDNTPSDIEYVSWTTDEDN